jgi:hypothetical protein
MTEGSDWPATRSGPAQIEKAQPNPGAQLALAGLAPGLMLALRLSSRELTFLPVADSPLAESWATQSGPLGHWSNRPYIARPSLIFVIILKTKAG